MQIPRKISIWTLSCGGLNLNQIVEAFTIITTEPNLMAARVHNRMPVIVGPEHYLYGWNRSLSPSFEDFAEAVSS